MGLRERSIRSQSVRSLLRVNSPSQTSRLDVRASVAIGVWIHTRNLIDQLSLYILSQVSKC